MEYVHKKSPYIISLVNQSEIKAYSETVLGDSKE
jgi:hypothetical protein